MAEMMLSERKSRLLQKLNLFNESKSAQRWESCVIN
jgi:hypothetical protein